MLDLLCNVIRRLRILVITFPSSYHITDLSANSLRPHFLQKHIILVAGCELCLQKQFTLTFQILLHIRMFSRSNMILSQIGKYRCLKMYPIYPMHL